MDKKNSELQGFDYPDLDLSDQEPARKVDVPSGQPSKKTKIDQSISKHNQTQNNPNKSDRQPSTTNPTLRPSTPFFPPPPGSTSKPGAPWIPPAPMVQKTNYQQQNYNQQGYNSQQNYQRPQHNQYSNNNRNQYPQNQKYDNREKKNTVYVKNIPKSYSTQDKLMTFFKNEGVIKQIKVNQAEQSAVIKFLKEQSAAKFLKSNKIIFNRSYIVYGESEFLTVSQQQIQDRANDELGNVKKAQQTNMKVLKEKVGNELAENIRALYFLQKHLDLENVSDEQIKPFKEEIKQEIDRKVEAKRVLETQNVEDFRMEDYNTSFYNWCLVFSRKSNSGIDRKSLFAQFLKYGPIISLDHECISQKPVQTQKDNQKQQIPKHFLDYRIKLQFLGIKNAWTMYSSKNDEIDLTVEGKQVQRYFDSGKLKPVQLKKMRQTEQTHTAQTLPNEEKTENQPTTKTQDHNQPELKKVQQGEKKETESQGS